MKFALLVIIKMQKNNNIFCFKTIHMCSCSFDLSVKKFYYLGDWSQVFLGDLKLQQMARQHENGYFFYLYLLGKLFPSGLKFSS